MSAAPSKQVRRRPPDAGAARADRVREGARCVAEKHNQVLFKVLHDATKPEIKAAVELMFKVEVDIGADRQRTRARPSASAARIGRRDHVEEGLRVA